jgi:hypothetical protein
LVRGSICGGVDPVHRNRFGDTGFEATTSIPTATKLKAERDLHACFPCSFHSFLVIYSLHILIVVVVNFLLYV